MEGDEQSRGELVIQECLAGDDADDPASDEDDDDSEQEIQVEVIDDGTNNGEPAPAEGVTHSTDTGNQGDTNTNSKAENEGENTTKTGKTGKEKKGVKRTFPCDECDHMSNSPANLKKHVMTHTGEKPFQCDICNKTFRQHHHLLDHGLTHSGQRPHKCDVCSKRFIQKSSLKLHKMRHRGVKPYSCSECSFTTLHKVSLVVHKRSHTGEKPYQCEKCGRLFSTSTRLKFHLMIHNGERRYKCEKCGVHFREKVTLQSHMAVHIKTGPFECKECGAEFSRLAGLSLHRKVHGNKDNFIYVPDKEASQGFKSACKQPSGDKSLVQQRRKNQEIERLPNSDSVLVEDVDDPLTESPAITSPREGARTTVEVIDPVTPDTAPQHPPSQVSCPPMQSESSANKVSFCTDSDVQHKLKEILASNIKYFEESSGDVHPDQVKEALEKGTVVETHGGDGKDLFIVLPPSLHNRNLMVLSKSQQTATTSTRPIATLDSSQTHDDGENILSENVSDGHKTRPGDDKEVEGSEVNVLEMDDETCGNVEVEIVNSRETTPDEYMIDTADYKEVLPLGSAKHCESDDLVHPDGSSFHLWKDDSVHQFTTVTHIIADGKNDPIVIFTQEKNDVFDPADAKVLKQGNKKCKGSTSVGKKRKRKIKDSVAVRVKGKNNAPKVKKPRPPKRVYDCEQCGLPCKTSSNYISHLRTHSGERPFTCGVCQQGFKQISHLRTHLRTHTGEKPYVCDICNSGFTQSSRLNSHRKNVHPNGILEIKVKKEKYTPETRVKNFYCRHCKKTFIGECLKVDHMKLHQNVLSHDCKLCGMRFKGKVSLQKHSTEHSDSKHVCELCGMEVASLEALTEHRVTIHDLDSSSIDTANPHVTVSAGEEEELPVSMPAKEDGSSDEIDTHMKSENFDDSDIDPCEVKHEVIHVTEVGGSVESDIEVTSTHVNTELAIHDITHMSLDKHNRTRQRNDSRKKAASCLEDDHQSVKDIEGKETNYYVYQDTRGNKVWVCRVCDRSFKQSSNLYCHLRMHTGDKPFQCNVCPKAFRQINHLKDHMLSHTGVKPHKCSVCGSCFTQKSAARRHSRRMHGSKAEPVTKSESDVGNQIMDALKENFETMEDYVDMSGRASADRDEHSHQLQQKGCICKVCQKQFTDFDSLSTHMKVCRKTKKVIATNSMSCECGKQFSTVAKLLKHQDNCVFWEDRREGPKNERVKIPSHGKRNLNKPDCIENKGTGSAKHSVKNSSSSSSSVARDRYQCKQCDEVVNGITSYKAHLAGHGCEGQEVCMVCGLVFRRASALRYHHNMKHSGWYRSYSDFHHMGYVNIHHGDLHEEEDEEEVEVKVEVEDDDFDFDYVEETEMVSSSDGEDEKELVSDMKGNVKRRKTCLNAKIGRERKSRGESQRCNDSVGIPGQSSGLKTNRTVVNEDSVKGNTSLIKQNNKKSSNDELDCKYCNKHFTNRNSYKKHVSSHNTEKPFQCEHCLLRFKRKPHLFNHYRTHARK